MNKQEFWPKEGKLRKGLIILAIVVITALLFVLFEEKTGHIVSKKITMVVVFACVGVWFYQPAQKEKA